MVSDCLIYLAAPTAAAPTPPLDLGTAQIDQIIGVEGHAIAGVYQIGVARRNEITMDGMTIAPLGRLGLAGSTPQPIGGGRVAITDDFALRGDDVNPVVKALRSSGIEVTFVP